MTLSKETINKTIEVLKEELAVQEKVVSSKYEEMKNFSYKNFVYYDSYCWRYAETGEARVRFRHVENEDISLCVNTNSDFAEEWSWSSWSFSREKENEYTLDMAKSEAYLMRELEKIQTLKYEYNEIKVVAIQAVEFYINTIQPEEKKVCVIERQIKELEEQIEELDKNSELEEAKQIFKAGTKHYFYNQIYYTNKYSSSYFRIEEKGKNLVYYTDNYDDSRSKKLTDDFMLELYKAYKSVNTKSTGDYDKDDNYVYKYFKASNYISEEVYKSNYDKLEWTEITKEELKTLK